MLLITPPSCTRVHHTPGKGQGRVPRGVPLPRPSCSQVRDKLGGPQPGSAPLNPARSETGRRIPSWALHPACHSPARWRQARESPAGPCVLPCSQALGPSCRNPLARVPSRRGREEKKSKVSTAKGSRIWRCCKWSLDTRNGLVSGLPWPPRSSPGAVASASWVLLLAPPDPGHPGSFSS